jgi:hypothetical protein
MSDWIPITKRMPEARYGEDDKPPIISEDVLILYESGMLDIANYDYDAQCWSVVNKGFSHPDCDPVYWMPIPEFPEGIQHGG